MDAYFSGGCQKANASDSDNVMSRTGMVIMNVNFPIYWCSTLQIGIAISTTEADYIVFPSSLRKILPLMTIME